MCKFISKLFVLGLLPFMSPSYAEGKFYTNLLPQLRDSSWRQYDEDIHLNYQLSLKKNQLTREEYLTLHENYLRKMRIDGLSAWKAQPNNKIRYDWLWFNLSTYVPIYYNYMLKRFDSDEKAKWDESYTMIKNDYMNYLDKEVSQELSIQKKFQLENAELVGDITYHKLIFQAIGQKFDLIGYAIPIIELVKRAPSKNSRNEAIHGTAHQILLRPDDYGVSDSVIIAFLKTLKEANIPDLSEWADGNSRMLKLKEQALEFSFQTVEGIPVDLRKMRGKVILIDFWATYCSSCLAYMPTIKEVYHKYHDKGLEVLSISINKNSEKEQVFAAEKKMNVSWPLAIIGGEKVQKDIWKRFAFQGVPQLLLLDKNGKLIENNGKLMDERTLNELLKEVLE